MKKYLILLNAFLITVSLTSTIFSQQTKEISPEKKAVIAEIITFTNAEVQTREIMEKMFDQMEAIYPSIIDSMVDQRTEMSDAEKKEFKEALIKKNADFSKRFNQKFIKMINFQEYLNEVFYPLYDKFFTVEELKDLLAFYKTPTGQKFNSITPEFSAESIRLAQIYLIPRIDGLIKEMMDEELPPKNSKGNPPPPKPKA